MPTESPSEVKFEIGHVLFIDAVGYSKLVIDAQRDIQRNLNKLVRRTEQFKVSDSNGKLVCLPTGDGMALVFRDNVEAPVRCAAEIARELQMHNRLNVRMGIHSGPVSDVTDVNERVNVAGDGINIAQRVMDCGDAGHILLSKRVADDLVQYGRWRTQLHPLGEVELKHGVKIDLFNLIDQGIGNPALPNVLLRRRLIRRRRIVFACIAFAIVVVGATIGSWIWQRQAKLRLQAAAQAAAQREKSIAILPFENLSTEVENAVVAGGVHREVLLNLAKIADLRVISRSSVMRYKPGPNQNLKQIADDLGVNYVAEGGVQLEGKHVRISVELIDARSGTDVWAETYDGNFSDVLTFQSEIAQRISNQLGAKLSPREASELSAMPTHDMAAFESYIRARALMETAQSWNTDGQYDRERGDYTHAVQLLEQAVARDPKFAAAYWVLSEANIQLCRGNTPMNVEYRSRAEAALKNAQRVAPEAGETLHAEARVIYYGYHDFQRALTVLEKAAKLLPNNAEVSNTRAVLCRRLGRWAEAYTQFVRGTELNPQEPSNYYHAAQAARGLRWFEDGARVRTLLIRRFPRFESAARVQGAVDLQLQGELGAADNQLKAVNPDAHSEFLTLFYQAFWKRDYAQARRLVNDAAQDTHRLGDDGGDTDAERERWMGEAYLAFVGYSAVDPITALEAEKQFQKRLENPENLDDADLNEALACVKDILGKKDQAIRMREGVVAKHPLSKDFMSNVPALRYLAYGYVVAGDRERALQAFAKLVQVPQGIWYGPLKYDPVLESLRADSRFDEILQQSQQPFPRLTVTDSH